jgi:glycosyltransferase involved in cell wall biosynthesis
MLSSSESWEIALMRASSISVVIPNYNHSQYIVGQLAALAAQTLPPLEVVVIDDASTDNSVEVVEHFAQSHPNVRLLRNERNLGVVATMNRGLKEARGELFYGCAADDLVAPCLIESVQSMSERYPQAGIYFGMYRGVNANDQELYINRCSRWDEETFAPPERFLNEYLEVEHCTHTLAPATTYRKSYVEEVGGFRPELGHTCDAFVMRAIGLKYGVAYTPKILASWRHFPESYSESSVRDFRRMLDIVARTAWLMRSPEFRRRFPESYVTRWEKALREYVIWKQLSSAHEPLIRAVSGLPPEGRSFPWPRRLWARLVLSYHRRRMRAYAPDLSCYSATPR